MLKAIHHRVVGNRSACMQMSRSTSAHVFPPVTSGSGTSRSPPYGPAPARTIGRPVSWPSSITVA